MVDSKGGAPHGNLNAAKNVLSALVRLQRGRSLPPELNRVGGNGDFWPAYSNSRKQNGCHPNHIDRDRLINIINKITYGYFS